MATSAILGVGGDEGTGLTISQGEIEEITAQFPAPDRPDLVLWALWSRNRREDVQGVYSHQTALSLHELSDLNPAKLHMTVPMSFRRSAEIPGVLVLHHADLPEKVIQSAQGFRFTRPLRTILDLISAGEVELAFIHQALRQFLPMAQVRRDTPTLAAGRLTTRLGLRDISRFVRLV